MPPTRPFLGIDLGGTNMQLGVISPEGKMLGQAKKKTKAEDGVEGVLNRIVEGINECCAVANVTPQSLGGLGIGAPGVIEPTKGVVVEVKKIAPLGDPIDIKLRGYELALRRQDMMGIDIQVLGEKNER